MNTKVYNQGRSYCYKLDKTLYRDILHDSWLHWFEKTSDDLFDEPINRVIRVIKLTWKGYYINKRKVVNRNIFIDYTSIDQSKEEDSPNQERHGAFLSGAVLTDVIIKTRQDTPEDIMIAKEMDELMISFKPPVVVSKFHPREYAEKKRYNLYINIYLYTIQGYNKREIAKILDVSLATVRSYYKLIKSYLAHFN